MIQTLRIADRGADGEGQDDWVSLALPPLAMMKQARRASITLIIEKCEIHGVWKGLVEGGDAAS